MQRRRRIVRATRTLARWVKCPWKSRRCDPCSNPDRKTMRMITLLLAGDVMTGRGIDQVMHRHCTPELHETWARDAREYVALAERANGRIPAPIAPGYIWGEALGDIDRIGADCTIINLETAITADGTPWPGKGIHYRMHPDNTACLTAAGVDVCVLANNHVLDWGARGLGDTLDALHRAGIATAGAGRNAAGAAAPAVLDLGEGSRLLVFSFATDDCGVPPSWVAAASPGVDMLAPDDGALERTIGRVLAARRKEDIVVVSIHWGENWVEEIPPSHRRIARRFIDSGAADVIHGHSSHHPLPAEVHRGKLVLYGCGDLINDYEGITTARTTRSDAVCLYAVTLETGTGRLEDLEIIPLRLRKFRLEHADDSDRRELLRMMGNNNLSSGTTVETDPHGHWHLRWNN
ncbi:MAG: CapA family protein [Chthoniobacterales bacterium]|nr:CapA family protein [Chthoniobacterales bacterium]